jgi:ABC-type sugar transport system ATPase subunit
MDWLVTYGRGWLRLDKDYILEMSGITKVFPGVRALDNVDFKVKRGETHCLLGANGAGKSTLIKVLSGAYQKDGGTTIFDGKEMNHYNTIDSRKAGIAIIYQELSLIDCLSIAENIFLNQYDGSIVNWKDLKKKAEEICKRFRLNLDVTKPVSTLSMGRKQLVEIMKALSIGAKLIVMDEPSATLSEEEFAILLSIIEDLKKQGITIVYISHRLDEIFQVGDNVTVMMNGRNVATRTVKSLNMDQLVELMIGHKVDTERMVNNSVRYDEEPVLIMDNAQSKKVGPINFSVHKGEIFGLYGLVGSGRTEVLRMIFGIDPVVSGQIMYKSKKYKPKSPKDAINHSIGLVPENRKKEGICQILPVWENATVASMNKLSHNGILKISKLKSIVKGYIKDLSIKTPSENTICRNLSGGNQQKVVLSKWLIKDSEFLLVDEPTQGIDVGAKDQIYNIIMDTVATGKSVLIVSSELDELVKICNKIAVMYEGQQINIFDMDTTDKNAVLGAAITGRVG